MKEYSPLEWMFLGIVIGDTFGSAYEFSGNREFIKEHLDINQYDDHLSTINPKKLQLFQTTPKGIYTDDTQMSIGVAKTLLKTRQPSQSDFANEFVEEFKKNPI
ncbi:MAG: ADP-ribosylglycohydrolase family protein, partial [Simkania sp.]|nr:ADP-ribosylglycohydrolase family protein [Simkania sp.]